MIKAYATNGDIDNAKRIYDEMVDYDINGDEKTFTLLLNAYNHVGKVDEAMNIWKNEIKDDKIKYGSYVMTCLVDCFGRKGMLDRAYEIILDYEQSKIDPDIHDITIWKSLLCIQKRAKFEMTQDNETSSKLIFVVHCIDSRMVISIII